MDLIVDFPLPPTIEPACIDFPAPLSCIGPGCSPIDLTVLSPVPEASSYVLLALGLLVVGVYTHFKHK